MRVSKREGERGEGVREEGDGERKVKEEVRVRGGGKRRGRKGEGRGGKRGERGGG